MRKKIMLMLILFLLTGCNFINGTRNNDETTNHKQPMQVRNSTIQNVDRKTGQQISEHLVDLATSIPKVNDATAVVIGNYALVGIDVDEDLERSEVGVIKYSVAESLKKDPHGARAVVIADPDITARIREISEDIQNGKPVQGIFNELADISGRLMPEIPSDLIQPNPDSNATKKQKENLDKQEKEKMDKQQEEQSNHHLNEKDN